MILVLLIFLSNVLPCGHAHGILQKSTGKLTVNVKAKISFFWKYLEIPTEESIFYSKHIE